MLGVLKVIGSIIAIALAIGLIAYLKWLVVIVPIVAIFFSFIPGVSYLQAVIGVGIVAIIIMIASGGELFD